MSYHVDELEKASDFQPLEGEANFAPPITTEVVGGAHIAPHCITVSDSQYVLIDWKNGLPRHDDPGDRSIRFPHGLIRFGESFKECAVRLVSEQLGMSIDTTRVVHVYSYVDDMDHWHMEPLILTWVTGEPEPPEDASAIYKSIGPSLPEKAVWWGKPPFEEAYNKYLQIHFNN
jgi:8-oxo-dGTP pyrophosphatase MutT (NUDIX family)